VYDGVLFDINADGRPDRVAWTEGTSDVGFLAMDRNHNGRIDNGSELFGSATIMSDGHRAPNGFEALRDLDGGPASDGRVDINDGAYSQILVWLDRNHNGISEPGELLSLSEAAITAVYTSYREVLRTDQFGNLYKYEGTATVLKNGDEKSRKLFDVVPVVSQ
jgi:hypothetical protein